MINTGSLIITYVLLIISSSILYHYIVDVMIYVNDIKFITFTCVLFIVDMIRFVMVILYTLIMYCTLIATSVISILTIITCLKSPEIWIC